MSKRNSVEEKKYKNYVAVSFPNDKTQSATIVYRDWIYKKNGKIFARLPKVKSADDMDDLVRIKSDISGMQHRSFEVIILAQSRNFDRAVKRLEESDAEELSTSQDDTGRAIQTEQEEEAPRHRIRKPSVYRKDYIIEGDAIQDVDSMVNAPKDKKKNNPSKSLHPKPAVPSLLAKPSSSSGTAYDLPHYAGRAILTDSETEFQDQEPVVPNRHPSNQAKRNRWKDDDVQAVSEEENSDAALVSSPVKSRKTTTPPAKGRKKDPKNITASQDDRESTLLQSLQKRLDEQEDRLAVLEGRKFLDKPSQLPVRTIEALRNLKAELHTNKKLRNLIALYLSRAAKGKNIQEVTHNITHNLFHDEVAVLVNYRGSYAHHAVKKIKLKDDFDEIIDIIRVSVCMVKGYEASELAVVTSAMNKWLAGAKDRNGGAKLRKTKKAAEAAGAGPTAGDTPQETED